MKRFILAAGVAALAISAPATAEKGDKRGEHKSHSAKAERGGGSKARSARVERRQEARSERRSAAKAERRAERRAEARVERIRDRREARAERIRDNRRELVRDRREARAERIRDNRRERMALLDRREDRVERIRDRRDDIREARRDRAERLRDRRDAFWSRDDDRWDNWDRRRFVARGLSYDCPPGLVPKGCIPPGQAKNMIGARLPRAYASSMLPLSLRRIYRDDDDYAYRYGDGYLYRVDKDSQLVAALMPLFGSALGLGQMFPQSYSNYYVPSSYRSFYPDTRDNYYRYANGYVYGIDRDSGLIENIVPLMAGGYGVGQMLPVGYSAYNVPYQYRDRYFDTDDYYYRYAPGAIYQVDPSTQLITSVASLLSPTGFAVGQPMPMGYSAYNVPYAYRDNYYDTADNWYRYNNGYIYQVDPTTQLITAIIRAIV